MKIGIILLSWLCTAVVAVMALLASGLVSIQIEITSKDKKPRENSTEPSAKTSAEPSREVDSSADDGAGIEPKEGERKR